MNRDGPDLRQSVLTHAAAKGAELRVRHGCLGDWPQLTTLLNDRDFVRYPCTLRFDAAPLLPGEPAYARARGERPEDGFDICVHPRFAGDPARTAALVLYQIVAVNYGVFAAPQDAEAFGAAALGLDPETYYHALCAAADELDGPEPSGSSGCGCGCADP